MKPERNEWEEIVACEMVAREIEQLAEQIRRGASWSYARRDFVAERRRLAGEFIGVERIGAHTRIEVRAGHQGDIR